MHKEYIKVPKDMYIDYVPTDGFLCSKCKFNTICPYDYKCKTYERNEIYENMDNDDTDIGDE